MEDDAAVNTTKGTVGKKRERGKSLDKEVEKPAAKKAKVTPSIERPISLLKNGANGETIPRM